MKFTAVFLASFLFAQLQVQRESSADLLTFQKLQEPQELKQNEWKITKNSKFPRYALRQRPGSDLCDPNVKQVILTLIARFLAI
jgi:hypothetical protein